MAIYWLRTCAECVAKRDGLDVPAAQAAILENRPNYLARKSRAEAFSEADAKTAEALPALGSKRQRRKINAESFRDVIVPIIKFNA
jgi:hypothetical protein